MKFHSVTVNEDAEENKYGNTVILGNFDSLNISLKSNVI